MKELDLTSSKKKVWKKPEVYILDSKIEGGGTQTYGVERQSQKVFFPKLGATRGPYPVTTFNKYHS